MANKYFNWQSSLKRFVRFDAARSEDMNDALDQVSVGLDSVETDTKRAIKLPASGTDQLLNLTPGQRANLLLGFGPDGGVAAVPGGGRFAGDWATGTAYLVSDTFRDPASKNIYSTVTGHTSTTIAADLEAGKIRLAVNVVDVELAKTAAQAAQASAELAKSGADIARSGAETARLGAEQARDAAQGYAASAVNSPGTSATSTTSLTITVGTKSLVIQVGKAFSVGQFLIIASTATPGNYMVGQITSHDSATGALVVNVSAIGGVGTFSSWTVSLTAASTGLATGGQDFLLFDMGVI